MKFYPGKRFSRIGLTRAPLLFFTRGCGASDFPPETGQHHSHTDYNAPHNLCAQDPMERYMFLSAAIHRRSTSSC